MATILREGKDRKVVVCVENTPGLPASELLKRKLGCDRIRHAPPELLNSTSVDGDKIVAVISGSPAARSVRKVFGCRLPRLPSSGYAVRALRHAKGRVLLIGGGDLFGMLAGMAHVLRWSEAVDDGLVYRGGDITEKPAFPLRYFWTWDHSANWMLDERGNRNRGSTVIYTKKPETFVEDYRRLVDHCVESRFNAVVIWGFLRDCHGGESYAHEVARYAADRGVAILPGIGASWYGGVYCEGHHPCNLETYLERHPDRVMRGKDRFHDGRGRKLGPNSRPSGLSPYLPENRRWLSDSLRWLYGSFSIGGINLENGDFAVDHSPLAKRMRERISKTQPDFIIDQYMSYKTALQVSRDIAPNAWTTYATYCGFGPEKKSTGPDSRKDVEDFSVNELYYARRMPAGVIAQWTLTAMLRRRPIPLKEWLETGRPKQVYDNPRWPRGIRPPTPRSAGFCHQPGQWLSPSGQRRTELALSTIAEACLRSREAGLEGISFHGEVSSRAVAPRLNYLAMRHFTYHPGSSLFDFARAELEPVLGGASAAEDCARALCLIEEGDLGNVGGIVEKNLRDAMNAVKHCDERERIEKLDAVNIWNELAEWVNHGSRVWAKASASVF